MEGGKACPGRAIALPSSPAFYARSVSTAYSIWRFLRFGGSMCRLVPPCRCVRSEGGGAIGELEGVLVRPEGEG